MKISKPVPLYIQVYDAIKDNIINGKLKPGERINEVQLSQSLDVSRGPVRESISKLEQDGLIIRNNRSILEVYTPDVDDLKDIYECRIALESMAAEKAAQLISQKDIERLERLINRSQSIVNLSEDIEESTVQFLELNSEFHNIIIGVSQNNRLMHQIDQLKSLTKLYRKYNIHNRERRKTAHSQHNDIFEALREKSTNKAKEMMEVHIRYDMESLTQLFLSKS